MTITPPVSARNNFVSEDGKAYREWLAGRVREGVAACEARGMTRASISKDMGFESDASLSKWTTGKQSPDVLNLGKLALATGLSLDWLIADRGEMFAPTGTEGVRLQVVGKIVAGKLDDAMVELDALIQRMLAAGTDEVRQQRGE